jgi:hypothetical protein
MKRQADALQWTVKYKPPPTRRKSFSAITSRSWAKRPIALAPTRPTTTYNELIAYSNYTSLTAFNSSSNSSHHYNLSKKLQEAHTHFSDLWHTSETSRNVYKPKLPFLVA